MTGLTSEEKIGHMAFRIFYKGVKNSTAFRLFSVSNSNINSSPSSLASSVSSSPEDEVVEPGDEDDGSPSIKASTFDITKLVNENLAGNQSFVFAIGNDYEPGSFVLADPKTLADDPNSPQMCSAAIANLSGLDPMLKFDEHSVCEGEKGYIALNSGKVFNLVNLFSTPDSKMPISVSLCQSPDRRFPSVLFKHGFAASFQYSLKTSSNGGYVLEDYTGKKVFYKFIDRNAKGFSYSDYGITHKNGGGSLYYASTDCSYFYLSTSGNYGGNTIQLYDKSGNGIGFLICGGKTQIESARDKDNHLISFTWNAITSNVIKPSKIANFSGSEIDIRYSGDLVSEMLFAKEKKSIEISYPGDFSMLISLYDTDSSKKLKEIEFTFVGDFISKVCETVSGNSLEYSKDSRGRISTASLKNSSNQPQYLTSYSYHYDFTKVTDFENKSVYYYFDKYGRIRTIMDDDGKTVSFNYDELEDGASKGAKGQSDPQLTSRNYLENHSFENDDLFQDGSLGWQKSGPGIAEAIDGGVHGGKCLRVVGTEAQTTTISQSVVSPKLLGDYSLKGFLKIVSSQAGAAVSVKVDVNYNETKTIDMPGTGVGGLVRKKTILVPHSLEKEYSAPSDDGEWTAFSTDKISLPFDACSLSVSVSIGVSGTCEACFDDFQLGSLNEITRYNLIENGNLEFADGTLPKGWSFHNLLSEDGFSYILNSDEHSPALDEKVMKFSAPPHLITRAGKAFLIRKMFKTIMASGNAGEELVFSVFAKSLATTSNVFRAYLKLNYDGQEAKRYDFDFERNLASWQMLVRSVIADYPYTSIEVGVEFDGTNEAYFDCFQLSRDSFGKYYDYDQRGNITQAMDSSGSSLEMKYENDMPTEVLSQDGNCFRYVYNNGKLRTVKDLNGNEMAFDYDSDGNVTKTSLHSSSGESIVRETSYDAGGNPLSSTDEHGNVISKTYDYLNRLTRETKAGGSIATLYSYEDLSKLLSIKSVADGRIHENTMAYEEASGLVKTITSKNGTEYKFVYDNSGRLLSIKANDETVSVFTYGLMAGSIDKGLVTSKRYGDSGDIFAFVYDERDQLVSVSLNGSGVVKFEYNENGLVSKSVDIVNNLTKSFDYNKKGKLTRIVSKEGEISLSYDNLGGIQKKAYLIGGKKRSVDFIQDYEANEYTKEGYFSRLSNAFGDEMVLGGESCSGNFGAKAVMSTVSVVTDPVLSMPVFSFGDRFDFIYYDLSTFNRNRTSGYVGGTPFRLDSWKTVFRWRKSFGLWIKPSGEFGDKENLLSFERYFTDVNSDLLSDLYVDSTGRVCYASSGSSSPKLISGKLLLGQWNYVAILIEHGFERNTNQVYVSVNGAKAATCQIDESVFDINRIIVSRQYIRASSSSSDSGAFQDINVLKMPFEIAMISGGIKDFTDEKNAVIYSEGKRYLVSEKPVQRSKGVIYYSQSIYSGFDVISLNGSLESADGIRPSEIIATAPNCKVEKARIFKFDKETGRHVYGSYSAVRNLDPGQKQCLAYDLPLGHQGTTTIRFKLDGDGLGERCLLAFWKSGDEALGVYVINNQCYMKIGDSYTVFGGKVPANVWHTLVIAYDSTGLSIGIDGNERFFAFTIDLTGARTYVGVSKKGATDYLNGTVEMLAFAKEKLAKTKTDLIVSEGAPIINRDIIDSLGRVSGKKISAFGKEFETKYDYDKLRVAKETILGNETFAYAYDAESNPVSITDEKGARREFSYDQLGRLTEDSDGDGGSTSYSYDLNGNILSSVKKIGSEIAQSLRYEYDSVVKDRLLRVVDSSSDAVLRRFSYDGNYKGNPTSMTIKGVERNLCWSARRLVSVGDGIHYSYDENGIRVLKSSGSNTCSFVLEGTNVVSMTERTPSKAVRLDFTYDPNGLVLGVTSGENEYFYVKDIEGRILGLIDKTGNYVVKYKYDAWGVPQKTILVSCDVAEFNPFLYKGYFYDEETGFYYLKSRYYDPTLRRFINADGMAKIDQNSLTKINLYSYCGDSPIEGYDPDGSWDWCKFAKVVLIGLACAIAVSAMIVVAPGLATVILTGAALGAASNGVVSAISQLASSGKIDGWQVATDTLFGAVGGALGSAGLGMGAMIIGNGIIGFVSSAASDWVADRPFDLAGAALNLGLGCAFGAFSYSKGQESLCGLAKSCKSTIEGISEGNGSWVKGLTKIFTNKLHKTVISLLKSILHDAGPNFIVNCLLSGAGLTIKASVWGDI
jgi:RHS repeat-associated protein